VWLVVVLIVALLLAGLELFWRSHGYLADVFAWEPLWAFQRERLEGAGRDTVALLGGSRMQIGFSPGAFHEVRPEIAVVQLADAGKSPLVALWDLARDESFRGVVLCAVPEISTAPGMNGQGELVNWYRTEWTPGQKYSLLLAVPLQANLVFLQPRLRGPKLIDALSKGRLPPLNYYRTHFDRSRDMYFDRLSPKAIKGLTDTRIKRERSLLPPQPPASLELWKGHTGRLMRFAQHIAARGGQVVFVNFPVRGAFEKLADDYFPRAQYWDDFARAGFLSLHWEDMPGQESLRLPDGSHLDAESAGVFTRWIARELTARGVI
jgi:hypothetical protein